MMTRVSLFPLGSMRKFQELYHEGGVLSLSKQHEGTRSFSWCLRISITLWAVVQKRLSLLLFLFILLIPSVVVFASSLNDETRINVLISDSEGQALSDVRVSLDLYFYEVITADQTELRGAYSDECNTDIHGMCTIVIGETQNYLLRGTLDLGQYGIRNLEWHGGMLDVPIRIDEQEVGTQLHRSIMYSAILFACIALITIVQHEGAST